MLNYEKASAPGDNLYDSQRACAPSSPCASLKKADVSPIHKNGDKGQKTNF